jgi:hexosaminidase
MLPESVLSISMSRALFSLGLCLLCALGGAQALFPQPQSAKLSGSVELSHGLHISQAVGPSKLHSHRLQRAIDRYRKLVFFRGPADVPASERKPRAAAASVHTLTVTVKGASEQLSIETSERYDLTIDDQTGSASLGADTIYGAIRGLETFSQLVSHTGNRYMIQAGHVEDEPRFAWRGLLVDSSRHFLPVDVLKQQIDAMAYSKFNVLHWHIVDSQSFPYPSTSHPKLTLGAYSPSHVYTQSQIKELVEFGLDRGVRVVPEFDTPGHTYPSWGVGYPELLTKCTKGGGPNGLGPVNPIQNYSYTFMDALLREVRDVFAGEGNKYVHLGGDEVGFECWQDNAAITAFMKEKGWGTDYARLEQYYEQRLLNLAEEAGLSYVVWQDPFDNGVKLASDTVVEVWRGGETGWQDEMNKVTAAGYRSILSSPWYLNYISYGADWKKYYLEEPTAFNGTQKQIEKLIGGVFPIPHLLLSPCLYGDIFVHLTLFFLMPILRFPGKLQAKRACGASLWTRPTWSLVSSHAPRQWASACGRRRTSAMLSAPNPACTSSAACSCAAISTRSRRAGRRSASRSGSSRTTLRISVLCPLYCTFLDLESSTTSATRGNPCHVVARVARLLLSDAFPHPTPDPSSEKELRGRPGENRERGRRKSC